MFNLEHTIAQWRKQMLAAGVKTPAPLDELEVHLRDELEQQMKSGRSEAEAFKLAAEKIGAALLLQDEFNKIEEANKGRIWKRFEVLILGSLSLFSLVAASILLQADAYSPIRAAGLWAVTSLLLLVWGGRWLQPKFLPRARQIRSAIYFLSGLLLGLWLLAVLCELILSINYFYPAQYMAILLWGMFLPMGAGMGFELGSKRCRFQKGFSVAAGE